MVFLLQAQKGDSDQEYILVGSVLRHIRYQKSLKNGNNLHNLFTMSQLEGMQGSKFKVYVKRCEFINGAEMIDNHFRAIIDDELIVGISF